jgi:hypothetical protein
MAGEGFTIVRTLLLLIFLAYNVDTVDKAKYRGELFLADLLFGTVFSNGRICPLTVSFLFLFSISCSSSSFSKIMYHRSAYSRGCGLGYCA